MLLQSPYNIFNLINSAVNLNTLYLTVPKGYQIIENDINNINLEFIYLQNINTINNNIFSGLNNLYDIYLYGDYDYIPSNAFFIKNPNIINNLTIWIGNSQINGSSFGSDVFTNPNRTLQIHFIRNYNLQTLKESIFGELFHKDPRNLILFIDNPLNCSDCDFKWIFDRKSELISQIIYAKCSDGRDFYNMTINDFNHCSTNNGMLYKS